MVVFGGLCALESRDNGSIVAMRLLRGSLPLFFIGLLGAGGVPSGAAPLQSVALEAIQSIYSNPLERWYWGAIGSATIDLRAPRTDTVRAHLQIKSVLSSTNVAAGMGALGFLCSDAAAVGSLCLDIPYANIRVRMVTEGGYAMRLNAGRARLTWGDGIFYNAADTIFGATASNPDLTQQTVRGETTWLLSGYFPLGRFGFIEPVLLPPLSALTDAPLGHLGAGVRIQSKIGELKGEVSYLFRAEDGVHTPALSVQGNVGIDWYLSTSLNIEGTATDAVQRLWESWQVSFGALHIIDIGGDSSLSMRLESLWNPGGEWGARGFTADGGVSGVAYGVFLYPEVVVSVSSAFQVYLRSIFSPIDLSALLITGVVWYPYTGLSFSFFPAVQVGEAHDTYYFGRRGGVSFTAGVSYRF